VGVVGVGDPVVWPFGVLFFGLGEGVLPESVGVGGPACGNGGVAGGGGEGCELGGGGVLWVVERVDVDEDGADDLVPLLAGGDVGAGPGVVVSAEPVVEDDGLGVVVVAEVVVEFELGRTAGKVLDGGVDEPDADVVVRAGPAVGGVLYCTPE
jgi:hypothetical protein